MFDTGRSVLSQSRVIETCAIAIDKKKTALYLTYIIMNNCNGKILLSTIEYIKKNSRHKMWQREQIPVQYMPAQVIIPLLRIDSAAGDN